MLRGDFIKRVYNIAIEVPIRRQFLKASVNINSFIKDYIDINSGFIINSILTESDFYYVIPYRYDQSTIKVDKINLVNTMNGDYTIYTNIAFDCIIIFKRQLITKYSIAKSTSVVQIDNTKTRVISLTNINLNLIESSEIKSQYALLHNLIYTITTNVSDSIKFSGYCIDTNDINVIKGDLDQPMVDYLIDKKIINVDKSLPTITNNNYSDILIHINKHILNRSK